MAKIQNRAISASAPTDGQVLTFVGANNDWEPATPSAGLVGIPGLDKIIDRFPLDLINGGGMTSGGGGGGSGFVYTWAGLINLSGPSGSAFATKGTIFTALYDFEIDEIYAAIQPGSTSERYSMGLYLVSTASSPVITSVIFQQTPGAPPNTNNQTWKSGAVTLTINAGSRYALAVSRTDATDTDACPVFPTSGAENSFPGVPINYAAAEGPNDFVVLAKKTPTNGDTFSTPAANSYAVGMKAKVTT